MGKGRSGAPGKGRDVANLMADHNGYDGAVYGPRKEGGAGWDECGLNTSIQSLE